MININVLTIGTIKESYLKAGIAEYIKRLQPYAKIEVIEISEEAIKSDPSPADIVRILEIEGKRMVEKFRQKAMVIALDIHGDVASSEDFALIIHNAALYQTSNIDFVIGGSWGLSEHLKSKCDKLLSFSKMTFPHQLMRLIFFEQLYRAFMINNQHNYHK